MKNSGGSVSDESFSVDTVRSLLASTEMDLDQVSAVRYMNEIISWF